MLNYRGDFYTGPLTSATFKGACTKGWNLFAITTERRIRKYTTDSLSLVASGGLGGATDPSGITFITPVSMAISFGTNRVEIWDSDTMASAAITTNTASTQRTYHQQIAGNPNLSLAMLTRQGAAGVTLVSPTCATSITPSFLSGRTINCIIPRLDSGTWILGTNGGRIYEMTSTGTQITAVHVPSGPIWGNTPTINVNSLAYSPSHLLAITDCGQLLHYNWETKALINQSVVNFTGSQNSDFSVLSNAASGVCLKGFGTSGSSWRSVSEVYFNNSRLVTEGMQPLGNSAAVLDCGINPDVGQAWLIGNNTASFIQLRIYDMVGLNPVNVSTTIQDPPGVYGAGRIIRIRDSGPGTASVESDQVIPNVATNIASADGKNYIELGLIGNTITGLGPYVSWDLRQMEA